MKGKMITTKMCRLVALMIAFAVALSGTWIAPADAFAAGQEHITDVKVGSYSKLDESGYSVMGTSLTLSGKKMYVGYKTGSGKAVTGLLSGASEKDGISYKSAGGGLHYTTDKKAGEPLVGLDIIRPSAEKGKNPPAIANDGSVIVRDGEGKPADFQKGGKTVYLAEIHDGSVMPYISEVVTVTGSDKSDAVMKAATYGYDYYAEGDADGAKDTYTILAYKRTADPEEAVTNVVSMSSDLLTKLIKGDDGESKEKEPEKKPEKKPEEKPAESGDESEDEGSSNEEPASDEQEDTEDTESENTDQEDTEEEQAESQDESEESAQDTEEPEDSSDFSAEPEDEAQVETEEESEETSSETTPAAEIEFNGDALDISGIEYDRMSSKKVGGKKPYYLYTTKDPAAGNPITMLYAGGDKETSETTLGIWAHGYFGTKGVSNAYSYIVNEEGLSELEGNTDVYIRKPVILIEGGGDDGLDIEAGLTKVSILTAKEGLPEDSLSFNGLMDPTYEPPKIVGDEQENPGSDLPASAFGTANMLTIVLGILLAAVIFLRTYMKKKAEKGKTDK